ncbi:hypothetical protein CMV_025359 [Castanea mollissima]|uniref:Pentatricopeptide repeat-containing protein n=1 Tax=Castanea mollissima TaxID=60419 RepID=A0A8J4VH05_9ROSI|nr:hypothetical protein CMV_025359 [Castanea mollissima]
MHIPPTPLSPASPLSFDASPTHFARTKTIGAHPSSPTSTNSTVSLRTSLLKSSNPNPTRILPPSCSTRPPNKKASTTLSLPTMPLPIASTALFHSDANWSLRVFYVYQKMKKFNVKPWVFLYNRIIDALMRNGYVDLAVSVYDDFRNDGLVEESVTFMVLIKGLCKVGRIDEMLKFLSKMRENLCTPDVFAYTAMVRVLVEVGNLDGCLRVWEEMKRDKVEPGRIQLWLLRCVKVGGWRKGMSYGKVGFACGLLKDLVDSGYRADLGIYNSIIEEMRRMDEFCKLLTQMEKLGFCVIDDLLKFFAFVVGKEERWLWKCLRTSKKEVIAVFPLSIYNILIGALHKKVEFKKVISLFDEVKESDFEPDSLTYNIAIECFVEIGDMEKACLCYNKIMEMSLVPSVAAYCAFAKGLCKTGDIDATMMLVRDCML